MLQQQVEPNRYYNGIGSDKTSTFYENWERDIELLLETGHTAFRTSIQWSRIFPQGCGKVNPQGVDFYRKVFEAIKAKLSLFFTFFLTSQASIYLIYMYR